MCQNNQNKIEEQFSKDWWKEHLELNELKMIPSNIPKLIIPKIKDEGEPWEWLTFDFNIPEIEKLGKKLGYEDYGDFMNKRWPEISEEEYSKEIKDESEIIELNHKIYNYIINNKKENIQELRIFSNKNEIIYHLINQGKEMNWPFISAILDSYKYPLGAMFLKNFTDEFLNKMQEQDPKSYFDLIKSLQAGIKILEDNPQVHRNNLQESISNDDYKDFLYLLQQNKDKIQGAYGEIIKQNIDKPEQQKEIIDSLLSQMKDSYRDSERVFGKELTDLAKKIHQSQGIEGDEINQLKQKYNLDEWIKSKNFHPKISSKTIKEYYNNFKESFDKPLEDINKTSDTEYIISGDNIEAKVIFRKEYNPEEYWELIWVFTKNNKDKSNKSWKAITSSLFGIIDDFIKTKSPNKICISGNTSQKTNIYSLPEFTNKLKDINDGYIVKILDSTWLEKINENNHQGIKNRIVNNKESLNEAIKKYYGGTNQLSKIGSWRETQKLIRRKIMVNELKIISFSSEARKLLSLVNNYNNIVNKLEELAEIYGNNSVYIREVERNIKKIDLNELYRRWEYGVEKHNNKWIEDSEFIEKIIKKFPRIIKRFSENIRGVIKWYYIEKHKKYNSNMDVDHGILKLKQIYQDELGGEEIYSENLQEQTKQPSRSDLMKEFVKECLNELDLKPDDFKLILTKDKSKTKTYAHFDPQSKEIVVYIGERSLGDIARSVCHEMVHMSQLLKGELDSESGETGSPQENEANNFAGVMLRKFGEKHPMIFESKKSNKKLLETIRFYSKEFDEQNNTNISKEWNISKKYNLEDIQNLLIKINKEGNLQNQEFQNIKNKIFELNPELDSIKINNEWNYWGIIFGVVSKFNFDDIKFFIEEWKYDSKEAEKYRQKLREIEKKYKIYINWIPSPKTLDIIIDSMSKKINELRLIPYNLKDITILLWEKLLKINKENGNFESSNYLWDKWIRIEHSGKLEKNIKDDVFNSEELKKIKNQIQEFINQNGNINPQQENIQESLKPEHQTALNKIIKGFDLYPFSKGFANAYTTKNAIATPLLAKQINKFLWNKLKVTDVKFVYDPYYQTVNLAWNKLEEQFSKDWWKDKLELNELKIIGNNQFSKNINWIYKLNTPEDAENIIKILNSLGYIWNNGQKIEFTDINFYPIWKI